MSWYRITIYLGFVLVWHLKWYLRTQKLKSPLLRTKVWPTFTLSIHSSGTVWESRWPSWAVRRNEPSGFRGRKELFEPCFDIGHNLSLICQLTSEDIKQHFIIINRHVIVDNIQSSGAVRRSRWTSWAPVPSKPTVSVDVKQHFNDKILSRIVF